MECTKCGGAIEGGRDGENAIAVSNGMAAGLAGINDYRGRDMRHADCLDG